MSDWIVAALLGAALSLGAYVLRERAPLAQALPMIALRAVALTLLVALVLDAPAGRARVPRPLVALDASKSWLRGGDRARWDAAVRAAREAGADTILLAGDSVRAGAVPPLPDDDASRMAPLVERALAAGRPLVLVTDGEVDDAAALAGLPRGSRLVIPEGGAAADAAVVSLEAPRAVVSGDTIEAAVVLRAGNAPAAARDLVLLAGAREVARTALDALPAGGERRVVLRGPIAAGEGPVALRAVLRGRDAEPRNDTLGVSLDVARAAGAVLASSHPDQDARFMVAVLRGAVALPTRAYYRVAPGQWRLEGSLVPVAEADVRRAVREAPLVVLHGDTAIFGPPRAATAGALALVAPPDERTGEWYVTAAPPSPIASALSGIPWDSLAPIEVDARPPAGDWEGLVASRPRTEGRRVAVRGTSAGRRVVVVSASGMWRWRFRGGEGADAYTAFWGGIFDWLAAEPLDRRAAVPAPGLWRAGTPIEWRRGRGTDSVVVARVRTSDASRVDTMPLRFGAGGTVTESAARAPGEYLIDLPGGPAVLVVNASAEMLPRPATVQAGEIGGAAVAGDAPRLRGLGWAYLLAVGALCAEWLLRRRAGLR